MRYEYITRDTKLMDLVKVSNSPNSRIGSQSVFIIFLF